MATKKRKKSAPRRAKSRPAKRPTRPAMDPGAMMAAWQKAATPADGHRRLEPMVGSWHAKTTFTMDPGAPAHVSEGSSEHRWILGGRYLEQRYSGTSFGGPFEGVGFTGFDNAKNRYVGTWMDTMGTGLMHSLGVGRPKSDEINFESEVFEPTGKRVKFDCKIKIQDRDHHTYEMWTKAPNGKRYRTMIVEYSRR